MKNLTFAEIELVSGAGVAADFMTGAVGALGAWDGAALGAEFGAAGGPIGMVIGAGIGAAAGGILASCFRKKDLR